ncbi:P-type conjugative transfer protein TrbL, partial [Ameyamaea chiangmaiensis]|nr:P-type conjugative transfer protein TrbL [Ameyamaea chiangmaiensis]
GGGSAGKPPAWASRMQRNNRIKGGAEAAAQAIKGGDRPSGGHDVDLSEGE